MALRVGADRPRHFALAHVGGLSVVTRSLVTGNPMHPLGNDIRRHRRQTEINSLTSRNPQLAN